MENPKISVIVPVHNAESYLNRCIDSILSQSYKDFEMLLIDDGSTDLSSKICDEYGDKDDRVKVFHKENGGVSSVRNLGLEKAVGQYIAFVDSDDWIEEKCLEENLLIAENTHADVIISDFFIEYKDNEIRKQQRYNGDLMNDIFSDNVNGALWNKFLKADVIHRSGLSFRHDLNFCEDVTFLCELTIKTGGMQIVTNPQAYYHYCVNPQSLTTKTTWERVKSQERYVEVITKILPQQPTSSFQSHYLSIAWGYLKLGVLSFEDYKQRISKVALNRDEIGTIKRFLLRLSSNAFGYAVLKRLLFITRLCHLTRKSW